MAFPTSGNSAGALNRYIWLFDEIYRNYPRGMPNVDNDNAAELWASMEQLDDIRADCITSPNELKLGSGKALLSANYRY